MWSRRRLLSLLCLSFTLVLVYYAFTPSSKLPVNVPTIIGDKAASHSPSQPPQQNRPSKAPQHAVATIIEQGTDIEAEGGVHTYFSRPDLKPAKWRVEIHDEERVAPGYWFITPIERIAYDRPGGSWIGPHIYDGHGELIWSGSHLFNNIWVADFRKINVDGKEMLSVHNEANGSAFLIDHQYRIARKIHTADGGQANTHEFFTVDDGRRFLYLQRNTTQLSKVVSRKELGYDGRCNVSYSQVVEKDVKSGEKSFVWSAEGKIPWSQSTLDSDHILRQCNHEWEYLHANGLDKFNDGHYLLSSRLADSLYKISKDDGSVLWRLHGNGVSDFEMVNLNFSRQHNPTILEQNENYALISLLDNAKGDDTQNVTSSWSRAIKVALHFDSKPMRAELVSSIDHPHRDYAFRRGNHQTLPNGNVFVGWSERALQTEYTPEGEMVLEAELVSEVIGTYRSFKFPHVGEPDYPPDVYSTASATGKDRYTTVVYVSWNGATEVAEWVLYKTNGQGQDDVELTRTARTGFETKLTYRGELAEYVFVQALDANGEPLNSGMSETVKTSIGR